MQTKFHDGVCDLLFILVQYIHTFLRDITGNTAGDQLQMDYLSHLATIIIVFGVVCTGYPRADAAETPSLSSYAIISRRNIFRPIWKASRDTPHNTPPTLSDGNQNTIKPQPIKEDPTTTLLNRKKEIESTLVLTGIISEAEATQAIIQNKKSSTLNYMVKTGDIFDDLKVISIDPGKNEVVLDYHSLLTVTLRLE